MTDRQVIWPAMAGAGQAYCWPPGSAGRANAAWGGAGSGWAEAVLDETRAGEAKPSRIRAVMIGADRRGRSRMPFRRICPGGRFTAAGTYLWTRPRGLDPGGQPG